jgi:acyl-CoA synthetase (AMP-forming)/AMP-acid ligase II
MNLASLLSRHARYRPEHLAVVFEDERLTFRQFDMRVNRLANALVAMGLGNGDKIATILPNCLEQLDVYWAAAKTGLVVVPMSPLLQEAGLRSLLDNSDSRLAISTLAFAEALDRLRPALPAIGADRWVLIDGARPGFGPMRSSSRVPPRAHRPRERSPAAILTTSFTPAEQPASRRASCTRTTFAPAIAPCSLRPSG